MNYYGAMNLNGSSSAGITPEQLEAALALKQNTSTKITQTAPTAITLVDNTEYKLTEVADLTFAFPNNPIFECFMRITTAASGSVTITFPASVQYMGTPPEFGNGETWEISIKDGYLAAAKAVGA